MEIIVNLFNLSDVFVLHSSSCDALFARAIFLWIYNLIDDDVMDVDVKFGELDSESFGFVET